jgi:hypothetical protein
MTARVFISYRRSDGSDRAEALARDLASLFGEDAVILDRDDPADRPWLERIAEAVGTSPILLVLLTPDYLGSIDSSGTPRIEAPHDPVRIELEAGLAAGARILPLLCDGVIALPDATRLPPPFDTLSRLPWTRLSTAERADDLDRLVDELVALGLAPLRCESSGASPPPAEGPITTPMPLDTPDLAAPGAPYGTAEGRRNVLGVAGAAVLLLGGWGLLRWRQQRAASLAGAWNTRIGARGAPSSRDGEPMVLTLTQKGRNLVLSSGPIDIGRDPEWEPQRDAWRRRTGAELTRVTYRGEGRIVDDDAAAESEPAASAPVGEPASGASKVEPARRTLPALASRRVLIDVRIEGVAADAEPIDTGTFRGVVDVDDQRIHGRLWLQSERAERVVDLRRGGA